jgi:hypothetical protein
MNRRPAVPSALRFLADNLTTGAERVATVLTAAAEAWETEARRADPPASARGRAAHRSPKPPAP